MVECVGQREVPLLGLIVPEHLGVSGLALEGDHRIARIDVKRSTVIGARGKALNLACGCRCVESHHGVFAKPGCVFLVDHAAAAEHCPESVGFDGLGLVLPVQEIGAHRVSPGHILPFGAVGVVLVVEMPFPVFVEHTVGVVHPSVKWGVVEGRTILFAICRVEGVGEGHAAPAHVSLGFSHRASSLGNHHVEDHVVTFVGGEIVGHCIIGLRESEFHINGLGNLSVYNHVDLCVVDVFLHGKNEIFAFAGDTDEGVAYSQMVYFNSICGDRGEWLGYPKHYGGGEAFEHFVHIFCFSFSDIKREPVITIFFTVENRTVLPI